SPLQRRHTSQPHLGLKLLYHAPKVRSVHGGEGAPASLRVGQARPFESQKCRFPASFNLPIPEVDPCRITETPVRLRYGSKGWPQFLPHRSREKLWLRQRDRLGRPGAVGRISATSPATPSDTQGSLRMRRTLNSDR